jgi:hypothetical protein
VTPADAVVSDAGVALSDSVTPADALGAGSGIALSDAVVLADALGSVKAGVVLGDTITLSDALQQAGLITLSETVTLTDVLVALTSDQAWDAGFTIWSGGKQPRQGRQNVGSVAKPLTEVVTSSANTVYTQTSVTDTAGWVLANVERHHIAVTEDGYIGAVESVAGNTVTVVGWWSRSVNLLGRAAARPAHGQGVTIHQVIQGETVQITAAPGNTDNVYLGTSRTVSAVTGFPISNDLTSPRSRLRIEIEPGEDIYINVSRLWVTALSAQNIDWVVSQSRR